MKPTTDDHIDIRVQGGRDEEFGRPNVARHVPPGSVDRLWRIVWQVVWFLLGRFTPIPVHGWRRMLLRIFGARISRGAVVYPSARVWAPWKLAMGPGSCLADGVDCYNVALVTLGRGAVVSQGAYLCSASHDPHDIDFPLIAGPIAIGQEAWVAAQAFVGPGVSVGDRAVVAARAVVVRSVPAHMIVGGNPARVLRERSLAAEADK